MRGLKRSVLLQESYKSQVASFTDAWIETLDKEDDWKDPAVASFTDAWIETIVMESTASSYKSHLLQMRGLKLKAQVAESWSRSRIFYRCVD